MKPIPNLRCFRIRALSAMAAAFFPLASAPAQDSGSPVAELTLLEMPLTQEAGTFQGTLGFGWHRSGGVFKEGSVAIEYGTGERTQVAFEIPYSSSRPSGEPAVSGWGDMSFGGAHSFIAGERLTLTGLAEFTAPTGNEDQGLGDGAWASGFSLAAGGRTGGAFWYGLAGISIAERSKPAWSYGVGLARGVGRSLALVAELAGEYADGGNTLYAAPGVVFKFRNGFELLAGTPVRLSGDGPSWELRLTLSRDL